MVLFSAVRWSALLAIVLTDLILAVDSAIVIELAARNLPPHLQKRAIAWGTVAASLGLAWWTTRKAHGAREATSQS